MNLLITLFNVKQLQLTEGGKLHLTVNKKRGENFGSVIKLS